MKTENIETCFNQLTELLRAADKCQPDQIPRKVTLARAELAALTARPEVAEAAKAARDAATKKADDLAQKIREIAAEHLNAIGFPTLAKSVADRDKNVLVSSVVEAIIASGLIQTQESHKTPEDVANHIREIAADAIENGGGYYAKQNAAAVRQCNITEHDSVLAVEAIIDSGLIQPRPARKLTDKEIMDKRNELWCRFDTTSKEDYLDAVRWAVAESYPDYAAMKKERAGAKADAGAWEQAYRSSEAALRDAITRYEAEINQLRGESARYMNSLEKHVEIAKADAVCPHTGETWKAKYERQLAHSRSLEAKLAERKPTKPEPRAVRLPHDCLDAARKLGTQHGGMASIRFMYDPYDADWVARADWSDAAFYEASGETPRDAWKNLLGKLKAAKAGEDGDE